MNIKKYTQKDRHGNMFSYEFNVPSMQEIPKPEGQQKVDPSVFKPKGTDTVPAMLTPGENVVNAEASRIPGVQPLLDELNDKGRAIQKKQGGPIPSYEADGGQVQYASGGYSIPNPMVSEKMIIEAYDKYLKGFNIDLPNPNMALNYEDFKESVLAHNAIKFDQGGQVPMYSAEGDFVIDDNLLDAIRTVETGNNPNQISEAGAAGPYQITEATAANPGYGVKAISGSDRFDEGISRAFAKDYLKGIKEKHPEFSRDQLLQAFHSGAGNVLKSIGGVEELGPRGQAYPGKVMNAMYDGNPPPEYPNTQGYSAKNEENKSFLESILPGITDIQKKSDRRSANKGLTSDSFLPLNPIEGDTIFGLRIGRDGLNETNEKIAELNKEIASQGNLVNPKDIKELEALLGKKKELEALVEEQKLFKEESNKPTKSEISAKETYDSLNVPKVETKDKKPPEGIKNIITDIVDRTDKEPPINESEKKAANEGKKKKDEDPTLFEEVKTELSKFFDTGELVRASLVYLGSRAMGYGHGSSLNFTGKNYLKRIDAQQAAVNKFANSEKATKAFTQPSLKDFVDSGGDRDKLIPIVKNKQISKMLDPVFDEKTNTIVESYQLNDKDKTVVVNFADIGMTPIGDPRALKRVAKVNENIHNANKIKENIFKSAKEFAAARNTATGADSDDKEFIDPTFTRQLSEKGYKILSRALKEAPNRDSDTRARIIGEINFAMGDMYDAIAKGDETITSSSLEKYFNARVAVLQTLGAVNYNDVAGFEKGFEKVRDRVSRLAGKTEVPEGQNRNTVQTKVYKGLWMTFKQVFDDYKALHKADDLGELSGVFIGAGQEEAGYNDFLNFVDKALSKNKDALAILAKLRKEI